MVKTRKRIMPPWSFQCHLHCTKRLVVRNCKTRNKYQWMNNVIIFQQTKCILLLLFFILCYLFFFSFNFILGRQTWFALWLYIVHLKGMIVMNTMNSYHYVKNTKTPLNIKDNKTTCTKIFKVINAHCICCM